MATYKLTDKAIVLRPEDDVAIAKAAIAAGTRLEDDGATLEVRQDIRPAHKIARRAVPAGQPVRRYGQVIGFATCEIAPGDHVHTHNLAVGALEREYEVGVDVRPVDSYPPEAMRSFDGYRREDGRVGTRNYVAVISTVNCSASVCRFIRDKFRDVQKDFPNVDGVLAITHKSGCGTKLFGEDHLTLQRVLAGYAKHPNVAAYLLIGLGCEVNQAEVLMERQRLAVPGHPERRPAILTIQEAGGVRKTVEKGIEAVLRLLPKANEARRTSQPISELILATNCGGSDGASGITANPALGWAVDELVRYGGRGSWPRRPDLRVGAPPYPAGCQPRRGEEAPRPLQVVGVVLPGYRGHGQQPGPRQQGGRDHDRVREVPRGRHQGRDHPPDGRVPLRGADHHARVRVHGYAGARSGVDHRARGRRGQRHLLHYGARVGVSARSRSPPSSSPRTPSSTGTWRRIWTSTAASSWRGRRSRPSGVRSSRR